jgi:hypothetical protein
VILRWREQPRDDVDRLLRDFFRAEMPDPWPELSPPEALPLRPMKARTNRWAGLRRRFAVAASVGLVLVGYLFLARAFPGTSSDGPLDVRDRIGNNNVKPPVVPLDRLPAPEKAGPQGAIKQLAPQTVTTRNGDPAWLLEQHLPGRRVHMFLKLDTPRPQP